MNSKVTKLIGALSIAALCSTVGCKSDGDAPPPNNSTEGSGSQPAGDGKSCSGGDGKSCSGGSGSACGAGH